MIKTLGPQGTFSDLAAHFFKSHFQLKKDITFASTIKQVVEQCSPSDGVAVIPIENSIDGYVQPSLDGVSQSSCCVRAETVLPIDYVWVSDTDDFNQIQTIHVQFKAYGQCPTFLSQMPDASIVSHQSNTQAVEAFERNTQNSGVVMPAHLVNGIDPRFFTQSHISDEPNNSTRFWLLSQAWDSSLDHSFERLKTSLVLQNAPDRPGQLAEILNRFAKEGINLLSIVSRPTKKQLGAYHFFIDLDGAYFQESDIIKTISQDVDVRILGQYPTLKFN